MGKSKFYIILCQKNAQLFMNHTWLCLLLLPSCIELRKSIGHKVKFFAIFNFLVFALSTVKIKSAKRVIFGKFYTDTLSHILCKVFGMLPVN